MEVASTGTGGRLRPLSVGEVLDAGFKVYRQHFGTLVVCVLVATAPIAVLTTLVEASTTEHAFDFSRPDTELESGYWVGQAIVGVLGLLATLLATAACFWVVSGAVIGRAVGWRESLGEALRRLGAVFWVMVISIVVLIPAFLALIVPGIWLAVSISVAVPALLVEGKRGFGALGRSIGLVRGRWWPTFGALLVAYVLVTVIAGVLAGLIFGIVLADSDNEVLGATVTTLVEIAVNALILPFQAAVVALIYFDLRVRKEGFDLELLASRVGTDAPPTEPIGPRETASGGALAYGGGEATHGTGEGSHGSGGFLPPRPGSGDPSDPGSPPSSHLGPPSSGPPDSER